LPDLALQAPYPSTTGAVASAVHLSDQKFRCNLPFVMLHVESVAHTWMIENAAGHSWSHATRAPISGTRIISSLGTLTSSSL
jgi:hypothetical protein